MEHVARHRRLDLINSMPPGSQKQIAHICNYTRGYVSAVLNGRRSQTSAAGINIIRLAEKYSQDANRRNNKKTNYKS